MSESNTAYLDLNGRPQLRRSIVAFIDVLGFSHIATSCTTAEESQSVLDKIAAAIDDSRRFVRQTIADGEEALGSRWVTKFFSDNLALGYPIDGTGVEIAEAAWFVIRAAQRYQLKMTLSGFFVRGALTMGPVCLTDEIIFGSALIDSYLLESKASIVPRIVLSESLQQFVIESHQGLPSVQSDITVEEAICRDIDGWWFINYLDAARNETGVDWGLVAQHKVSIQASLSQTKRHDVLPKYGWACRYHNVFCYWHRDKRGYSNEYRITRSDEESTIDRFLDAGGR